MLDDISGGPGDPGLDMKICNCAGCGRELVGSDPESLRLWAEAFARRPTLPPRQHVGGRINGRPYCSACLAK